MKDEDVSTTNEAAFLAAMAARLLTLRTDLGLSRKAFCGAMGVSARTLEKYEYAEREASASFLAKLRSTYGVDINWVLTGEPAAQS